MLRAIYDLAFAYIDGDVNQADASAGTAAGTLLRLLFNHAGSILYKMQAGMGDTVFTPFYLALRERGVKFRFFHTVTRLGLSDDHRPSMRSRLSTGEAGAGVDGVPAARGGPRG